MAEVRCSRLLRNDTMPNVYRPSRENTISAALQRSAWTLQSILGESLGAFLNLQDALC